VGLDAPQHKAVNRGKGSFLRALCGPGETRLSYPKKHERNLRETSSCISMIERVFNYLEDPTSSLAPMHRFELFPRDPLTSECRTHLLSIDDLGISGNLCPVQQSIGLFWNSGKAHPDESCRQGTLEHQFRVVGYSQVSKATAPNTSRQHSWQRVLEKATHAIHSSGPSSRAYRTFKG
jgi:hypothetical protein